ncbi:hypothetical protein [Tenacibaculum sp. nBUS_03]|uniref:hypothetical protein n=1 Tax=Tenacibaculum sp. nBUS_03 TaxID=3395320 RepID=UPI003EB76CE4
MKFEKTPPFTIKGASYVNITGGMPGNNSTDVKIAFSSPKKVIFEKVYFMNKIIDVTIETKGSSKYIIGRHYYSSGNNKYNIQLHDDSKKEYGNTPPKVKNKFPFELKENEAVLSYKEAGKIKYFKLENIKKGKDVIMQ